MHPIQRKIIIYTFSFLILFVFALSFLNFSSTIVNARYQELYTDDFDGANDTVALKSRGYLVLYRGTGPQGSYPIWFQGQSTEFPSFNGPPGGYVAANDHSVTMRNNIDNWLVFPRVQGGINNGDSLYFYERSPSNAGYPDSMRVMYSANDSLPEGNWVELGRFKTTLTGWNLRKYAAPVTSVNGRFAIRYCIVNGGPTGENSIYVGIDAARIVRNMTATGKIKNGIPSSYSLGQNYPNPFNPVTKINYSVPAAGFVTIKVYDVLGREICVLANGYVKPGNYEILFDGTLYSSGAYFINMTAGDFISIRKIILIK